MTLAKDLPAYHVRVNTIGQYIKALGVFKPDTEVTPFLDGWKRKGRVTQDLALVHTLLTKLYFLKPKFSEEIGRNPITSHKKITFTIENFQFLLDLCNFLHSKNVSFNIYYKKLTILVPGYVQFGILIKSSDPKVWAAHMSKRLASKVKRRKIRKVERALDGR